MSLHDFSAFPYLSFSSKTSAGFLFIRPKICSRAPSKSFGCSLRKLHKKNHISNIKPELWKRRRLPREYDWTSSYTSFLSLIYYVLRGIDLPGAYFRLLPPRALLAPICPLRAPTWTTPLLLLDGDSFSFFILYNFLPFSDFVCFHTIYIRACCRRACIACTVVLQYREYSKAQVNLAAQSPKESAWRSECDNASKQQQLARASTCHREFIMQHAWVLNTNEEVELCRAYKIYNYPHRVGAMREGFSSSFEPSKIQHRSVSRFLSSIYFVHACGARDAVLENGALGFGKKQICT